MRAAWLSLFAACGDNRTLLDEPALPEAISRQPTYYQDIAPILTTRCGGCHVDGGVGPFPLATFDDAASRSELIASVTSARTMPPWPADSSGECNNFVDARWLSESEIHTIQTWHALGDPAGDPADLVPTAPPAATPFTAAIELGANDIYVVRPGPDEYRCFVVDPGLSTDRYMTAIAMRLDRADVVHHVQLFAADDAIDERNIDAADAADPGPGWVCGNEGIGANLRYVAEWSPGDLVRRWPDGTGLQLHAGHRLVLQLHYHNHGATPIGDQSRLALELADSVEHAGRIASAAGFPLNLPPHQPEVTVTTDTPFVTAGEIRAVRIHMHTLGTHARMELFHDGQSTCVLDIPQWDFNWQLFYRLEQPIAFASNDLMRISCSFDTETRDAPVTWGIETSDEMCLGYSLVTER